MLSDIQKAIIKRASIKITTPNGVIEIVRGDIVNAEYGEQVGEEAFYRVVGENEYTIEPLDSVPPTTITSGWVELKTKLFEDKGYSTEFDILFKNVPVNEDELNKLVIWIEQSNFTGFLVAENYIIGYVSGEPYYARHYSENGILKSKEALMEFLTTSYDDLSIYISAETVARIMIGAMGNLTETSQESLSELRRSFALEGANAVIISKEGLEVFYEGLRIVNSNDSDFTTKPFPELKEKAFYGRYDNIPLTPIKAMYLSKKDIDLLANILENNIKLFSGKIGRDAVRNIIQKHSPKPTDPESIMKTIEDLIREAKNLGGKGWMRKVISQLTEGIDQITNDEIKRKLSELFSKI